MSVNNFSMECNINTTNYMSKFCLEAWANEKFLNQTENCYPKGSLTMFGNCQATNFNPAIFFEFL